MSFRHVTTVAVAALAAATVLSACGGQVEGEAASTSTRSVTPKAATETGVAPKFSGPGPVGQLQDVSGQGNLLKGLDGQAYALRPEPGVKVSSRLGGCTLGPAIKRGAQTGFLVARHCDGDNGEAGMQYARVNAEAKNPLPLAPITETYKPTDSGVIWTPEAAGDSKVAGVWPVRGMLTVEQVRELPEGSTICFNAAVSGVICGGKIGGGLSFTTSIPVHQGDSGSAAFVVDSRGDAWLAGVVTDSAMGGSLVRSAADIVDHLNATLITAP